MSVRLVFVFLFIYAACPGFSAIIGIPRNQHVNNIENKPDKTTSLARIATENNAKTMTKQIQAQNNTTGNIEKKEHAKYKIPILIFKKKVPTQAPEHKKLPDSILKQEVPKPLKKLQHLSIEDLLQRRKEFKEKWQARHNKLWHIVPQDEHTKTEDNLKATENHSDALKLENPTKKIKYQLEAVTKKGNMMANNSEKLLNHVGVYEQVTPRTRRILEHKEEGTQSLGHPGPLNLLKTKSRFSSKYISSSTSSTIPVATGSTESINLVVSSEHLHSNDTTTLPKSYSEVTDTAHTTENLFKTSNHVYQDVSNATITETTSKASITTSSTQKHFTLFRKDSSTTATTLSSVTKAKFLNNHSTNLKNPITATKKIEETSEGTIENQKKNSTEDIADILKHDNLELHTSMTAAPKIEKTSKRTIENQSKPDIRELDSILGYIPEEVPSETTTPSLDDVVSVKIDTSKGREEAFTTKVDTQTILKNLTDREKKLYQKPSFNYGRARSAVQVIDVHHLDGKEDDVKEKTKGKSAHDKDISVERMSAKLGGESIKKESVENISRISSKTSKEEEYDGNSSEGSAMKISGESQVNHDWREHLRRAVKERLRTLRHDSENN